MLADALMQKAFMSASGQAVPDFLEVYGRPLRPLTKLYYTLCTEELEEIRQVLSAIEAKDPADQKLGLEELTELCDGAIDLLYVTLGLLNSLGIPPSVTRLLFDEVHRSNMSKIPAEGEILFRVDGKVEKPETYFKPDLGAILLQLLCEVQKDVKKA